MLKKIKNFLGIEGVKIELLVEDKFVLENKCLEGEIRFTSQSDQYIEMIHIRLIEKYRRGRGEALLINEYVLGETLIPLDLSISRTETRLVSFSLHYDLLSSEMDEIQKSYTAKPFVWLAKKVKNVKSEFRLEATAEIKGTKLQPIAEKILQAT